MSKLFNVLVIDDDEDDQFLLKVAFQADDSRYRFEFASDATKVMEVTLASNSLPDLIFLDLNMPLISGFDILKRIKTSPQHRHIPVIVLSTSDNERDVNRCYELGANTFVVKPSTHQGLIDFANLVQLYWFSLARRPTINSNQ